MAVFRIEKTRDYTVMSNYHLRDRSLSLKAKGLLSLMLSLPEDWDYTMKGLHRVHHFGAAEGTGTDARAYPGKTYTGKSNTGEANVGCPYSGEPRPIKY